MMRAMGSRKFAFLVIAGLLLTAVLQGCATRLDLGPADGPRDAENAAAAPALTFQRLSALPEGEGELVGPDVLQPGDILLTSMPGFAAATIELMTVAPVSHAAVYIGDGQVVEAVRSGVGERDIDDVLADESVVLVLRYPGLTDKQAQRIREYARRKTGAGFNFVGVTLQIPYAISRKACELPLIPGVVRDACIQGMGVFSRLAASERRLFCSQLVLQAYEHAGVRLTDADARIISPADILHMREGDVSSVRILKPLRYVGHLKYDLPVAVATVY